MWGVMPCSPEEDHKHLEEMHSFCVQGQRVSEIQTQKTKLHAELIATCWLVSCLGYSSAPKVEAGCFSKMPWKCITLHCSISKKAGHVTMPPLARWIQPILSHPISLILILILYHLYMQLSCSLFEWAFPTKTMHSPPLSYVLHAPFISSSLICSST